MRNQTIRKEWIKKDHKFKVFDDLSQSEIAIENCSKVIDFTRCSYSIKDQDKVYLLIENE